MKKINIKYIKPSISSAIISGLLAYFLFKTNDLLSKIVISLFLIFGISFCARNILLILNKNKLAGKVSKIYIMAFLFYFFGFILMWCYTSLKNSAYLQTLFSLPFWLLGIYFVKKRLVKPTEKTINEKSKIKFNIDFRILISALLVGIVFISGIVMLFFGIRDTYRLNSKIKDYITAIGYFNNYDVFDVDENGITYKLTYVYTVKDKEYSVTTDYGTNYIPEENSSREIKYNPNNPEEAIITGTNNKNGLIYFGAFFTFGSLTFILAALSVLGYFDKFKIDILGIYIGVLFFLIGIGIILFQTGTTTSLTETVKSFGMLILIPVMFIIVGIIQIIKCLLKKK